MATEPWCIWCNFAAVLPAQLSPGHSGDHRIPHAHASAHILALSSFVTDAARLQVVHGMGVPSACIGITAHSG